MHVVWAQEPICAELARRQRSFPEVTLQPLPTPRECTSRFAEVWRQFQAKATPDSVLDLLWVLWEPRPQAVTALADSWVSVNAIAAPASSTSPMLRARALAILSPDEDESDRFLREFSAAFSAAAGDPLPLPASLFVIDSTDRAGRPTRFEPSDQLIADLVESFLRTSSSPDLPADLTRDAVGALGRLSPDSLRVQRFPRVFGSFVAACTEYPADLILETIARRTQDGLIRGHLDAARVEAAGQAPTPLLGPVFADMPDSPVGGGAAFARIRVPSFSEYLAQWFERPSVSVADSVRAQGLEALTRQRGDAASSVVREAKDRARTTEEQQVSGARDRLFRVLESGESPLRIDGRATRELEDTRRSWAEREQRLRSQVRDPRRVLDSACADISSLEDAVRSELAPLPAPRRLASWAVALATLSFITACWGLSPWLVAAGVAVDGWAVGLGAAALAAVPGVLSFLVRRRRARLRYARVEARAARVSSELQGAVEDRARQVVGALWLRHWRRTISHIASLVAGLRQVTRALEERQQQLAGPLPGSSATSEPARRLNTSLIRVPEDVYPESVRLGRLIDEFTWGDIRNRHLTSYVRILFPDGDWFRSRRERVSRRIEESYRRLLDEYRASMDGKPLADVLPWHLDSVGRELARVLEEGEGPSLPLPTTRGEEPCNATETSVAFLSPELESEPRFLEALGDGWRAFTGRHSRVRRPRSLAFMVATWEHGRFLPSFRPAAVAPARTSQQAGEGQS